MDTQSHQGRLLLVSVGTLILIALAMIIFVLMKNNASSQRTPLLAGGKSMALILAKKDTISTNEPFIVQLYADSDKVQTTGYDALVMVGEGIELLSATSLNPDFSVVANMKNNQMYITGAIKANIQGGKALSGPVAQLTLRATQKGPTTLDMVFTERASDDSNMYDTKTVDILENVSDLTLDVK